MLRYFNEKPPYNNSNVVEVCELDLVHHRQLQSDPAPPVESQYSCQPTVKLHILPLVWIFTLGKG